MGEDRAQASIVEGQLQLSLYYAARAFYPSLRIVDARHPFWVISHVLAGRVEGESPDGPWTARAGTVMLHPPHLRFSERADGPGTHEVLFFDARTAANLDLFRLFPVPANTPLASPAAWSETFERLLQSLDGGNGAAPNFTAYGLAAQLFGLLLQSWRRAGAVPRPPSPDGADRFTDLIQYMGAHLGGKIGRDDLAARAHLHPAYFHRVFRETYGLAPMQMLRDLRLDRARQMLEGGDDTLETIAGLCGFEDAAYFSRVFHKRFGLPPGRHRRRIRESVKSAAQSYSGPLPSSPSGSTIEAQNAADAEGD